VSTNQCPYGAWILRQCWEVTFISVILQYFGYRWSYDWRVRRVYSIVNTELSTGVIQNCPSTERPTELSTELSIYRTSTGVIQNQRVLYKTSTNHRGSVSWMDSVYLMGIRDSGLVWITVHTCPGLCIISTVSGGTFVGILGIAYEGERVAWILLV